MIKKPRFVHSSVEICSDVSSVLEFFAVSESVNSMGNQVVLKVIGESLASIFTSETQEHIVMITVRMRSRR